VKECVVSFIMKKIEKKSRGEKLPQKAISLIGNLQEKQKPHP
jgi:hypothetical protein